MKGFFKTFKHNENVLELGRRTYSVQINSRSMSNRGGVESTSLEAQARTQKNPRPRPRTALPRTDPFDAKERNARGKCQRHRRKCSPLPQKKGLCKFSNRFLAFSDIILTVQKIVLPSSRGQENFRGLEALRPRARNSKCVLEDFTLMSIGKDTFVESVAPCIIINYNILYFCFNFLQDIVLILRVRPISF